MQGGALSGVSVVSYYSTLYKKSCPRRGKVESVGGYQRFVSRYPFSPLGWANFSQGPRVLLLRVNILYDGQCFFFRGWHA